MALKFSDFLLNSNLGSIKARRDVELLDSVSTILPSNVSSLTVDSIVAPIGARILYTNLTDLNVNNKIYQVVSANGLLNLSLQADGHNADGSPANGEIVLVEQGASHSQTLWGFKAPTWSRTDFSSVTSGVSSLNSITGATNIVAGSNVTVTPSGQNITIAANSGSGTVTSVAATVPSFLNITGSPVTTSGTLAIGLSGTALPIANGGTGQTSASNAFNALNPMTTTGDIIYESATGIASRLPIGSTGEVMTVAGGVPSWGAASGGALVKLGSATTSGSQATVVFNSIPNTYTTLKMVFNAAQDSGSFQAMRLIFNGVADAQYIDQELYIQGTTITAAAETTQAIMNFSDIPSNGNNTVSGEMTIPFYANTAFYKNTFTSSSLLDSSSGYLESWAGQWLNQLPINSITISLSAGNFIDGSQFVLYAMS